jgi:hypothetical protein
MRIQILPPAKYACHDKLREKLTKTEFQSDQISVEKLLNEFEGEVD